jgi:antitoxin VapB
MAKTAKVFQNGASQAVRLPKEFRFDVDEVCIRRVGSTVVLYPKDSQWDLLLGVIGKVDDDFMPDRGQPAKPEKRKRL